MQLDVYRNPVAAARRAYPFVITLHSARAAEGDTQIVAFMAPAKAFGDAPGRLTPKVEFDGAAFFVDMLTITSISRVMIKSPLGDLASYRDDMVAAIDWLFLGV